MDVLRSIILRGHIRNTEEPVISPNTAAYALELIPNNKLTTAEPVVFEIGFLDKNRKTDYHLSIDPGTFLERVHIKRASKIIANMITERKIESSLS